eukprot:1301147-Rhodomonas_salina.2
MPKIQKYSAIAVSSPAFQNDLTGRMLSGILLNRIPNRLIHCVFPFSLASPESNLRESDGSISSHAIRHFPLVSVLLFPARTSGAWATTAVKVGSTSTTTSMVLARAQARVGNNLYCR